MGRNFTGTASAVPVRVLVALPSASRPETRMFGLGTQEWLMLGVLGVADVGFVVALVLTLRARLLARLTELPRDDQREVTPG
jgi:hypothetical protein